jgi:hypothetical protein
LAEYYNIRLGKFLYINGSYMNHLEPVLPEVRRVMKFGIDNTGLPRLLRGMLEYMRQHEV